MGVSFDPNCGCSRERERTDCEDVRRCGRGGVGADEGRQGYGAEYREQCEQCGGAGDEEDQGRAVKSLSCIKLSVPD